MKIKRKLVKNTLYICLGLLALYLICKIIEDKMKVKENYSEKNPQLRDGGDLDEIIEDKIKAIDTIVTYYKDTNKDMQKILSNKKNWTDIRSHKKWKKFKNKMNEFLDQQEELQEFMENQMRSIMIFDNGKFGEMLEDYIKKKEKIKQLRNLFKSKKKIKCSKNKEEEGEEEGEEEDDEDDDEEEDKGGGFGGRFSF